MPARRDPGCVRVIASAGQCNGNAAEPLYYPSSIHEPQAPFKRVDKNGFLNQQADNDERFVWEVEEVAGVHQNALGVEQIQDQCLLGPRGGNTHRCTPSAVDTQELTRAVAMRPYVRESGSCGCARGWRRGPAD